MLRFICLKTPHLQTTYAECSGMEVGACTNNTTHPLVQTFIVPKTTQHNSTDKVLKYTQYTTLS